MAASTSAVPLTGTATADTPASQNSNLDAAVFQRLHPRAYFERFLAEGFRPDGREPLEWREVSLNVGSISTAEGSALVRIGDTTVVCGVKAEIAEPELDRPEEGFLVPNLDLPAISSPKFKPGPPTEEAQALSDALNAALTRAGILSALTSPRTPGTESPDSEDEQPLSVLCIHPGRAVWVLYVDAVCINYDGNAFDAALMAMVAALRNTRLPKATYDPETRRTLCSRTESVALPFAPEHIPLSLSFGVFDSTLILTDPTSFEEPLLDSTLSITTSSPPPTQPKTGSSEVSALISITQLGPAPPDALQRCIALARTRTAELRALVRDVEVKFEAQRRDSVSEKSK